VTLSAIWVALPTLSEKSAAQ